MQVEEVKKHAFTQIADAICKLIAWVLGIGVLMMVILIFGNVVLRYGFNSGITVSEEVSRIAFVWITFLGSILALRQKQHLGVNMLVHRMPISLQKWIHLFRQVVILVVLAFVIEGGISETQVGLEASLAVTGLPQALFSGVVLFSAVGMFLVALFDLFVVLLTPANAQNLHKFCTSLTEAD